MKKRWLSLCGIYFLGLATIPGLMLAEQWLRQSQASRPKFTDTGYKTENATASSFALLDDTDPFQELVVAKNSESASTNSDKKAVGSSATERFRLTPSEADRKLRRDTVQSNSPATAQAPHKTKPVPARNSDFEEFAAADQKPPQREIQLEEEFGSPLHREPVSIVAPAAITCDSLRKASVK